MDTKPPSLQPGGGMPQPVINPSASVTPTAFSPTVYSGKPVALKARGSKFSTVVFILIAIIFIAISAFATIYILNH